MYIIYYDEINTHRFLVEENICYPIQKERTQFKTKVLAQKQADKLNSEHMSKRAL